MRKFLLSFCSCLVAFALGCVSTTRPQVVGTGCSDKFWDSFQKMSEDQQLWNRLTNNPIITKYRGYVVSSSSEALYSPSNCQRREADDPVPNLRSNELDILKDGNLYAKTYWLGGLVLLLTIQAGENFVQILAGEFSFESWQKNGKPVDTATIIKKNLLVYRVIWRGELK